MKRLVFIVEGDTEISFIENHVIPYLYNKGISIPMHGQTILTSRRYNKKGGVVSYQSFKNEVTRTFSQGDVLVTTMIDFFRIPSTFPNYSTDKRHISIIESGIHNDFENRPDFYPYIQLHEIEALMFSNIEGFKLVVDEPEALVKIQEIITDYPNPEDINNSPATAPSKRLAALFNYNKVVDGEMILEMIGMETILQKCPRFAKWIKDLEEFINSQCGK